MICILSIEAFAEFLNSFYQSKKDDPLFHQAKIKNIQLNIMENENNAVIDESVFPEFTYRTINWMPDFEYIKEQDDGLPFPTDKGQAYFDSDAASIAMLKEELTGCTQLIILTPLSWDHPSRFGYESARIAEGMGIPVTVIGRVPFSGLPLGGQDVYERFQWMGCPLLAVKMDECECCQGATWGKELMYDALEECDRKMEELLSEVLAGLCAH